MNSRDAFRSLLKGSSGIKTRINFKSADILKSQLSPSVVWAYGFAKLTRNVSYFQTRKKKLKIISMSANDRFKCNHGMM